MLRLCYTYWVFSTFIISPSSTSVTRTTAMTSNVRQYMHILPVHCCHGTTIVTSDCTIVTSEQHLYQTIVQFDETVVLPRKLATGNIHDYLFWYCPLVGILFEVLRINIQFVLKVSTMFMLSQTLFRFSTAMITQITCYQTNIEMGLLIDFSLLALLTLTFKCFPYSPWKPQQLNNVFLFAILTLRVKCFPSLRC